MTASLLQNTRAIAESDGPFSMPGPEREVLMTAPSTTTQTTTTTPWRGFAKYIGVNTSWACAGPGPAALDRVTDAEHRADQKFYAELPEIIAREQWGPRHPDRRGPWSVAMDILIELQGGEGR